MKQPRLCWSAQPMLQHALVLSAVQVVCVCNSIRSFTSTAPACIARQLSAGGEMPGSKNSWHWVHRPVHALRQRWQHSL